MKQYLDLLQLIKETGTKKEDRTGILEWRIQMDSKDKKVIDFKFKVKHDKNKRVTI